MTRLLAILCWSRAVPLLVLLCHPSTSPRRVTSTEYGVMIASEGGLEKGRKASLQFEALVSLS